MAEPDFDRLHLRYPDGAADLVLRHARAGRLKGQMSTSTRAARRDHGRWQVPVREWNADRFAFLAPCFDIPGTGSTGLPGR
jgi:hypothetical protein